MQIKRVSISNFRAIRDISVEFGRLTTIIGENNSGKSAVLAAIALFFDSAPRIDRKDFYNDNISDPVQITISFHNLTPAELLQFSANIIDDELTVTRTFNSDSTKDNGAFSVDSMVNPDFIEVRNNTSKTDKRELYRVLREQYDLDSVTNADQIDGILDAWEAANPDKLRRQKIGGFRGFKNVAIGQLRSKCEFILVQAVRDAANDVADSKRSPVLELLNTIARQTIENNIDFQNFKREADSRILSFTDPRNVKALSGISDELTGILGKYYSDSSLIATWQPLTEIPISFPAAQIEVKNGLFTSDIGRVGHGLQRAVILTVLEYVARRRSLSEENESEFIEAQSDIILAIEEPEIYQHPTKQRLFRHVLKELSSSFSASTGIRLQIICVTHSSLFVDISRCEEIRVIRKHNSSAAVTSITLRRCAELLGAYSGKAEHEYFSESQMAARMHVFTPEIAEGFFARKVILVEGISDKSLVEASFANQGRSCTAEGIVIANAGGKNNIDRLSIIFRELKIPFYIIIDNDQADNSKRAEDRIAANKLLQQISGVTIADCVDWPEGVHKNYCAWDGNIEKYIKSVVGTDAYDAVRNSCATEFGISAKDCEKSPTVATEMMKRLLMQSYNFQKLDALISAIDDL